MRSRVAAAVVPIAVVVFAWASLESEPGPRVFGAIAMLSLLAAIPPRLRDRVLVAAAVALGLTLVLAGTSPTAIREVTRRGLSDVYAVPAPFDTLAHHEMHVLVALTAALFCLAIAVTAPSRPLLAAGVTIAGVGWPATILPLRNTVAVGALALLAALWPLAVAAAREGRGRAASAAALACLVAVAAAAGSEAKPATAALDWQSWDLFTGARAERTVSLVWESNYGGIDFPARETTVLRIVAPRRALYWRATTLENFTGDRWIESLYVNEDTTARATLERDDLLPPRSRNSRNWVEQKVDVEAVIDDRVVAAAQPMAIAGDASSRILVSDGGVLRAPGGLDTMRRYSVWSFAPSPTPAALVRSAPVYPQGLDRYRDVGRASVPWFGVPGRAAAISSLFDDDRYRQLWPYEGLWREAERRTATAGSPYQATIALERWLRADGGFVYDEHPPAAVGAPPLADFVARSRRGYCQQFAGAMALMLRYLGIPARVAVGFTSGTWKDGAWTVTDHDAHAWVEAWFAGHGWLAFDPTPGRGTLTATYTNASDSADAIRSLADGRYLDLGTLVTPDDAAAPAVAPEADVERGLPWQWAIPLVALAVAVASLALAKSVRRQRRWSGRDPRSRAAAARGSLVAFLRDQGSTVDATASIADLNLELRRLGIGGDAFAAAFSRARYGPPESGDRAVADTRRELRRVLSLLRARLGAARRVRGFFSVSSLRGS